MQLLGLVILAFALISQGNSTPFFKDIENGLKTKDYMNTMPYSRAQIEEVRRNLNLTYNGEGDPDEYLSVSELIAKYGYPVEEHFVTTSDGYILKMHRIPPTKKGVKSNNRVAFLMHGIIMSSADWVLLGPEKALAYHLSDLGYDVWMGNARGNTQSRNHTKLSPKSRKFWNFSWHEIGVKDVPAMIDSVLKKTGKKQLYHIGHSQGTTSFYVMCSELPQYNKKIIAHYSLAPIAYMKHTFSPILKISSKFALMGEVLTSLLGINELLPHMKLIEWLGNTFCGADKKTEIICRDGLFMITGFDKAEFNDTLLPTFMGHTPAGSSAKQMFHYAQLIDSGKFRQYDYSPLNAIHYGPLHPLSPPSYNLKKVTAPVYLYYSRNDWLSHETDVTKLCKDLKNCKAQILVSEKSFNHMDYVWGIHAKEVVYEVLTDSIKLNAEQDEKYEKDAYEQFLDQ